jgi:hypothetical protein
MVDSVGLVPATSKGVGARPRTRISRRYAQFELDGPKALLKLNAHTRTNKDDTLKTLSENDRVKKFNAATKEYEFTGGKTAAHSKPVHRKRLPKESTNSSLGRAVCGNASAVLHEL